MAPLSPVIVAISLSQAYYNIFTGCLVMVQAGPSFVALDIGIFYLPTFELPAGSLL